MKFNSALKREKMRTLSTVVIWFVLVCGVASEAAESPPASQLLDRIVALENRDYEQSKRISSLEQRMKLSEERVQQLTMANEDLIKHNSDQLKEKDEVTTKLQIETQALKLAVEEKELLVFNLQSKLKEFDEKKNEQQTERIKVIARQNSPDNNLARQSVDEIPSYKIYPKSHKDEDTNNTDEPQERYEDESYQAVKNTNKKLLPKLRVIQHFAPEINNVTYKVKRVATNNDLVAFHAAVHPNYNDHFGTNDNIKFDDVLLNLGGGYHNQHGLFIAPKRGLYLFSVTVAVKPGGWAWADVMKNGVRIAAVLAEASTSFGEGSTTFVTLLEVSDEVWVVHTNPPDGSFWGNGHTSFTGVLISET